MSVFFKMYKVYRVALGIGISLSAIAPASAATVNFELTFFDGRNTQVGSGTFSFDDEVTTCVEPELNDGICYPGALEEIDDENSPFYPNFVIGVENALTDFDATLFDTTYYESNWSLERKTWWSDEESGQVPGYQSITRYGISIRDSQWFFGGTFPEDEQLVMKFESFSDTFGAGSWITSVAPFINGFPSSSTGTWEATIVDTTPEPLPSVPAPEPNPEPNNPESVPEPIGVLGLLSAVCFSYFTKRKTN